MNILFDDIIQYSNAISELKTPMLNETIVINNSLTINFDKPRLINSVGFGNITLGDILICDGGKANTVFYTIISGGKANTIFNDNQDLSNLLNTEIILNDKNNTSYAFFVNENGLYTMPKTVLSSSITINTIIKSVGRIGAGLAINIPTAIAKEPTFCSTASPRITLSGQIINGLGGYNFKMLSLDSRYKINEIAMKEIMNGYKYISLGYPFFIDLTVESYKLPFKRLYAIDTNQQNFGFESGIRKYLFSRRFIFKECF